MEFVFVIPREELFVDCTPHGLQLFQDESSDNGDALARARSGEDHFRDAVERTGFFVERSYAERTPALKQVIPYTLVVRRGSSADQPEIFRLTRTKAGGEARLHNKISIGVGGHIEPVDLPAPGAPFTGVASTGEPANRDSLTPQAAPGGRPQADEPAPRDPIPGATRREVIEEELDVSGPWRLSALGLINDDTNSVGAVHVGLVQLLEVSGAVSVRETDQLVGQFSPLPQLLEEVAAGANYESWSSLILPHLGPILTAPDFFQLPTAAPHAPSPPTGTASTAAPRT